MVKPGAGRTKSRLVRSRETILHRLKQQGPSDAEAMACQLGISAMAVRQHLYALRSQKLVTYQEQPRPVGRPAKMWSLTSAANRFFPDAHANLTVNILNATGETYGKQGLRRVVTRCAQQQIANYRTRIPARSSFRNRLEALVSIRNDEGYMAQAQQQEDGSFLLIENHCPIAEAASACPKLCDAELEIFRVVLGENVLVEREEHILLGTRRCVYRIRQIKALRSD
jgi:predicted ArsR family transcriptional regulator